MYCLTNLNPFIKFAVIHGWYASHAAPCSKLCSHFLSTLILGCRGEVTPLRISDTCPRGCIMNPFHYSFMVAIAIAIVGCQRATCTMSVICYCRTVLGLGGPGILGAWHHRGLSPDPYIVQYIVSCSHRATVYTALSVSAPFHRK